MQLLDHEPRAAKQVPLLLKMKEDNLAVVKAIESGDPDLGQSISTASVSPFRSSAE